MKRFPLRRKVCANAKGIHYFRVINILSASLIMHYVCVECNANQHS